MTPAAKKAPKPEKFKKQTPEERLEAARYNHIMYGPTAGELKLAPKKINYGAPYLKHPKFLSLIEAFKKGAAFKFEVSDKNKAYTISTNESQILFDDKVIYYCRPLNRFEQNLLMDRASIIQNQTNEVLVHLVFAIFQSFPELGALQLSYRQNQFYYGAEPLDAGIAAQGPNLLMGSFKHTKVLEKTRA